MGLVMTVEEAEERIKTIPDLQLREMRFAISPTYKERKRLVRSPLAELTITVLFQGGQLALDPLGMGDNELSTMTESPEETCLGSGEICIIGSALLGGSEEETARAIAAAGSATLFVSDGVDHLGANIYPDELPILIDWLHRVLA